MSVRIELNQLGWLFRSPTQVEGHPCEVPLPRDRKTTGVVLADAIRNLNWSERRAKCIETASPDVISSVHSPLMALLELGKR